MNRGLEQVRDAVSDALEKAGLVVCPAFSPGWAKQYSTPVAAVGLRSGESRSDAFNSYLGRQLDPDTQAPLEVYGMRLDMTLSLDIYAPAESGAAGCDQALNILHQVMLDGLPSGLRPTELRWEEAEWDETTSMFLRKGCFSCSAYFVATATEEGAWLTDFILKGVVTK